MSDLDALRDVEADARAHLWELIDRYPDCEEQMVVLALDAYRRTVRATQLAEIQGMDRMMRAVAHYRPPSAGAS